MRNIDEDADLLNYVRRHYEKELTTDQMNWILKERGYDKSEIEGAVSDFYWIHIKTPSFVNNRLIPFCIVCLFFLILVFAFGG